jgi:metallo-beta-lactamase family protein
MRIHFLGAAQTVTGSMHLVETEHARVLLDGGLFQGRRAEAAERNRNLPLDPRTLDAVVLSHAHIDHSGALPMIVKRGYDGPIFATPATADLADAMLRDSAMIQRGDADYLNRHNAKAERHGAPHVPPIEPIYDLEDAVAAIGAFEAVPYHVKRAIAPGVTITFYDAGHVLGSAVTAIDVEEGGATKRVVFTGDLGRTNAPILRDPEVVRDATLLIMESTYGDRLHDPIAEVDDKLAAIVKRTFARGGKVLIPSFALERAQEVLYSLTRLQTAKKLGPCKIYVDSPLTVKITEVFRRHPECFDAETVAFLKQNGGPFEPEILRYVSEVEESKSIDASAEPSIIVAASGMCEAGRILHHLKAELGEERSTVILVGYQAQHTLGRRLLERRPRVRIFGVEHERRIEVEQLAGFSAHADRDDLTAYARHVRESGKLGRIALVHGELPAQKVLRQRLLDDGAPDVVIPEPGQVVEV